MLAVVSLGWSAQVMAQRSTDINVAVSIRPLHSIVASIMQGVAMPVLLLDSSQSAHHASLKPSQAKFIAQADIIFWMGASLETFLPKPLATLGENARHIALIDENTFANRLQLLALPSGAIDPHLWLSVPNAILVGEIVKQVLVDVDGPNAQKYNENLARFRIDMNRLGEELANILTPVKNKHFLVYHGALGYLEHQYGFSTRSLALTYAEIALSAKQIASIGQLARSGKFQCLLIEPQINASAVIAAAKDAALPLAAIDPMGTTIDAGRDLYSAMMRNVAQAIASCSK